MCSHENAISSSDEDSEYYDSGESVSQSSSESEFDEPLSQEESRMKGSTHASSAFEIQDTRFWSSPIEKQHWIHHFQASNKAYIKRYGCSLDSLALPQALQRYHKEKKQQHIHRMIMISFLFIYLVIFYKLYHSNQTLVISSPLENDHFMEQEIKCSNAIKELAKARNEDHAVNIAVDHCKKALNISKELNSPHHIKRALISQGDMHSLLNSFVFAEKYYSEAAKTPSEIAKDLLRLKRFANQCLHHFTTAEYATLRSLCLQNRELESEPDIQALATSWLSVFEKKIPIAEALKRTRHWTFTRLPRMA